MQVQSLNNYNNQPSFGKIYIPKKLNEIQKGIASKITTVMREPLPEFSGKTAEQFYELKGLDFQITPFKKDFVYLIAIKGRREIGTGTERSYTYSDQINIGEYNINSEFKLSDIETKKRIKQRDETAFISIISLFIVSTILFLVNGFKDNKNITKENAKYLIENVDSIRSSVVNGEGKVLKDTAAFLKGIRK